MKLRNLFYVLMILLLVNQWAIAATATDQSSENNDKVLQTYVNCSILIDDYSKAQVVLNDMVKQYGGNLKSINFDQQNNSGNASVQINSTKVNSFLADLKSMGQIESSSFSSSDYTRDYVNYKKKLKAYQKFYDLLPQALEKMDLSKEDKSLLQQEMIQLINSQTTSLESTVASYAQYNNATEVSIQLRYGKANQKEIMQVRENAVEIKEKENNPNWNFYGLVLLYILVIGNMVLTYSLLNRSKKSPFVS